MGVTAANWYWFLLAGAVIGTLAGMLGIGGGVLVIPALVFLFGFSQKTAVGTSLAMLLPPIGFLAILGYWPQHVNVRAAALLAAGFAAGGWVGGRLVKTGYIPERTLRILFAFFLLYLAGNLLFRSEKRVAAALKTVVIIVGYGATYLGARLLARRIERRLDIPEAYRARLGAPLAPDYEI